MGTADEESRICVEHGGSEPGALVGGTALTGIKSWFRIWVLGRARLQPCRSRPGKMRALAPEGSCLPGWRAFIKPAQLFDPHLESKITRQAITVCPRDMERAAILRERVQSFSILL